MYLGGKEIKECPHKTVTRFYNSPPSALPPQWRCDWCGQEFAVAAGASKVVELSEPAVPEIFTLPVAADEPLVPVVQAIKAPQPAKKKEKSIAI